MKKQIISIRIDEAAGTVEERNPNGSGWVASTRFRLPKPAMFTVTRIANNGRKPWVRTFVSPLTVIQAMRMMGGGEGWPDRDECRKAIDSLAVGATVEFRGSTIERKF